MRVALITHCFPSREHPYVTEWVQSLVRVGVGLEVFAERLETGIGHHRTAPAVRLAHFSGLMPVTSGLKRNLTATPRLLSRPRRALAALAILRRTEKPKTFLRKAFEYWPFLNREFDLVHFNAAQIAIRRFELAKLWRAKSVVSFRGQDLTLHPDRYDRLLREADHLHFISRHLLEEARKRGYAGQRHTLIYPAVSAASCVSVQRKPPAPPPGPFILFSAARLVWTKGWEFALQAVSLLVKRGFDIEYWVAGDGELRPALLFTADQLGLNGRVRFLGWLSPPEVQQRLSQCDLYLLASVEEAFNNSVLQAQACAVPVVCSDAGGLPENVVDGLTGLVARRRDAWDLAEKIAYLLERPDLRVRMGEQGRARATAQFDLESAAQRFAEMYRKVLAQRSAG